jgi:cytochrome c553
MRLFSAIVALLPVLVTAGSLPANDFAPAGARNCTWCHGTSGHGYAPAPQLAGQRHQYIENELLDFHNHVRDNPFSQKYMWGAAANLNAQTARDLAIYFSTLPPKSANDGIPQLADIGREIYFEGVPDNIVPCAACHGPTAEGIRNIPRLAGQSYAYLSGDSRSGARVTMPLRRRRCQGLLASSPHPRSMPWRRSSASSDEPHSPRATGPPGGCLYYLIDIAMIVDVEATPALPLRQSSFPVWLARVVTLLVALYLLDIWPRQFRLYNIARFLGKSVLAETIASLAWTNVVDLARQYLRKCKARRQSIAFRRTSGCHWTVHVRNPELTKSIGGFCIDDMVDQEAC